MNNTQDVINPYELTHNPYISAKQLATTKGHIGTIGPIGVPGTPGVPGINITEVLSRYNNRFIYTNTTGIGDYRVYIIDTKDMKAYHMKLPKVLGAENDIHTFISNIIATRRDDRLSDIIGDE